VSDRYPEHITKAECFERAELLAAEVKKLVRAHVDSLSANDGDAIALSALGPLMAYYAARTMCAPSGAPPPHAVALERLRAFPWAATLQMEIEVLRIEAFEKQERGRNRD